jgi:hypothetical protein
VNAPTLGIFDIYLRKIHLCACLLLLSLNFLPFGLTESVSYRKFEFKG